MKNILLVFLATTAVAVPASWAEGMLSGYASGGGESGAGSTGEGVTYTPASASGGQPFFKVEEPLVEFTPESDWAEPQSAYGSSESGGDNTGNSLTSGGYQAWTGNSYTAAETATSSAGQTSGGSGNSYDAANSASKTGSGSSTRSETNRGGAVDSSYSQASSSGDVNKGGAVDTTYSSSGSDSAGGAYGAYSVAPAQ